MLRIVIISHQSRLEGAERSLLELIEDLTSEEVWVGVISCKKEGPLMHRLDQMKVPWCVVPAPWWTRSVDRPYYPAAPILKEICQSGRAVEKILKEWDADLVYSNTSVTGIGAVGAMLADLPHIWHIREAPSQPDDFHFLIPHNKFEALIDQMSNRVIFNSGWIQKQWTNRHLPRQKTEVIYNRVRLPLRLDDNSRKESLPAVQPGTESRSGSRVDVIIPMHNDPFILRCLESLIENRSELLHRVYILDDMTEDQQLIEQVQKLVDEHESLLEYRRNPQHLGFVGTCNLGMEISDHDVVLLNSDTLVTEGWLEKLKICADADEKIATVTPMSNNASLVSLPKLYTDNPDGDPEKTARWIERIAPTDFFDIPTSHGFCVYIKRDTIRNVGVFDHKAFGLGYGEENDLSMRVRKAGMRNVAALRAYVYHKGAQSFGKENKKKMGEENYKIILERYPEYPSLLEKFRKEDPFQDLRKPLEILKGRNWPEQSFHIVMAGKITRLKRHEIALRAVADLVEEGKEMFLWIVGNPLGRTTYQKELEKLIKELQLKERVFFTGPLKSAAGMLHFADAVVTCNPAEAFGRVTLEAMLTETPVIGADGGGTSELIRDRENGLLFKPDDIEDLAEKLSRLYDNPDERAELGKRAHSWAIQFQENNRYSEQILQIMRSTEGERHPSEGISTLIDSLLYEQRENLIEHKKNGVIGWISDLFDRKKNG